MSSRHSQHPWPVQTTIPQPTEPPSPAPTQRPRSLKRRRVNDDVFGSTFKSIKRQVVANQAAVDEALRNCQLLSGNDIISCYPTANTVVAQSQWISFIWNSRRPQITQANRIDIYLFHGDSREQILHIPNLPNPSDQAGRKNIQVNDSWWGDKGGDWNGKNLTYPFYFILTPSGTTVDVNAVPQATFNAVQTTFADSIIASMSSSSVSAASAASVASLSAASVSSASSASLASLSSARSSSTAGSVQANSNSGDFPHWAIAVIVVLGFLAIAVTCILAFLIIRRVRRQHQLDSNRNSMGSASPMMANPGGPSSPLLAGAIIGGGGNHPGSIGGGRDSHTAQRDAPSVVMHDGASTISRTGSAVNNEAPFSGADAAIMADAFRKMLRKPDFAGRPVEEGESPDGPDHGEGKEELISRELAEEGRDIRSVSSERGVRVETLSDSGDTVQDRHGKDAD